MSMLKAKRSESRAEYVNLAGSIFEETVGFLTRMSARYARLLAEPVAQLAGRVMDECEAANSIYPSSAERVKLREAHLLEARAALMALDRRLTYCYRVMSLNPEGCFTTGSGQPVKGDKASAKLDKMAQRLGEKIDQENSKLQEVLKSDKRRMNQ